MTGEDKNILSSSVTIRQRIFQRTRLLRWAHYRKGPVRQKEMAALQTMCQLRPEGCWFRTARVNYAYYVNLELATLQILGKII